jgi:hypothetical protein
MKKVVLVLMMMTLLMVFAGCNDSDTTPATPEADTSKGVTVIVKNDTGENWALDATTDWEEDWLDGSHYLDSDDFMVAPDGETWGDETSEGKILLLAAKVLEEDIGGSHEITYMQELSISGNQGDTIYVQWNGSSFEMM